MVAVAPGGFESMWTSWYGPWTMVAQPPRSAAAATRMAGSRFMGPPSLQRADGLATSPLAEHRFLELLGDREADLLAGGNLDLFAGLRIAADAGFHLAEAE